MLLEAVQLDLPARSCLYGGVIRRSPSRERSGASLRFAVEVNRRVNTKQWPRCGRHMDRSDDRPPLLFLSFAENIFYIRLRIIRAPLSHALEEPAVLCSLKERGEITREWCFEGVRA